MTSSQPVRLAVRTGGLIDRLIDWRGHGPICVRVRIRTLSIGVWLGPQSCARDRSLPPLIHGQTCCCVAAASSGMSSSWCLLNDHSRGLSNSECVGDAKRGERPTSAQGFQWQADLRARLPGSTPMVRDTGEARPASQCIDETMPRASCCHTDSATRMLAGCGDSPRPPPITASSRASMRSGGHAHCP